MSALPSRRQLLQAAAVSPVVAACTSDGRPGPARVDPDVAIRQAAVARERELVASYRAAAASSASAVARVVEPLLAEHEQHLAALGAAPDGSPSPEPERGVPTATQLAAAERSAATAHAAAALQASRPLAAVLASLSASEASHAVLFA